MKKILIHMPTLISVERSFLNYSMLISDIDSILITNKKIHKESLYYQTKIQHNKKIKCAISNYFQFIYFLNRDIIIKDYD